MSDKVVIDTQRGPDRIILQVGKCWLPFGIMIGQTRGEDTERVYINMADWPTVREAAQRVYDAHAKTKGSK